MRNPRYRAWDGAEMRKVYKIIMRQGGVDTVYFRGGSNPERPGALNTDDERLHLMPYIGIDDVNGIPIYEGDVVLLDTGEKCIVINRGAGYLGVLTDSYYQSDLMQLRGLVNNQPKVIGNIYQGWMEEENRTVVEQVHNEQ